MSELHGITGGKDGKKPRVIRSNRPQNTGAEGPLIGISEDFDIGDFAKAERFIEDIKSIGLTELRTGISWAGWMTPEGEEWYDWLLPRLAKEINVLPSFLKTPGGLGISCSVSSPPKDTGAYADFIETFIERFGKYFEAVELWGEPNNIDKWDWRLDPEWKIFSALVAGAARVAQGLGKKTILPATYPFDPNWFNSICAQGMMTYIDVIGVSAFTEFGRDVDGAAIVEARDVLKKHYLMRNIWVTGAGYSTMGTDELGQMSTFLKAAGAPVERIYWDSMYDSKDRNGKGERGIKREDGKPKLLFRMLESGIDSARDIVETSHLTRRHKFNVPHALITGGAGFIGTNLADRLLSSGTPVVIFDNLSRPGVERNLRFLRDKHESLVQFIIADVCDNAMLREALDGAGQVYHFAAQVAVTESILSPMFDFRVNALGTVALLEELRKIDDPPPVIFTSTNKVYGALEGMSFISDGERYEPADYRIRANGINETQPLDFHSPYGCSKGAAESYIIDYARTYGLNAAVFRMSCIYGPHQMGTEDQGWVAHFLKRAIAGTGLSIYGDGKQVRDLLYVDDLVDAFIAAREQIKTVKGQAFNIGGGPENTLSLLELVRIIEELAGEKPALSFGTWRQGDQKYYVSDTGRFKSVTGWEPKVPVEEGIKRLYEWLDGAGAPDKKEKEHGIFS